MADGKQARTTIDFSAIAVQPGTRASLIGQTGTGKSTLAKTLVAPYPHCHAFDIKGQLVSIDGWDALGFVEAHSIEQYQQLANEHTVDRETGAVLFSFPRIVYVPSIELEEIDDLDVYDKFFRTVYERQNTACYVDEIFAIVPTGRKSPSYFRGCLTRGRGLRITMIMATQRPVDVPNVILSESEKKYVFRLVMEGDRKKVQSCTGLDALALQQLPDYYFYYSSIKEGNSALPLKLQLK